MFRKNSILLSFICFVLVADFSESQKTSSSLRPNLYHVQTASFKKLPSCSKSSPEIFYNNVAEPSLSLLYHRGKAMFGILMDQIEESYKSASISEDLKNKTREQWGFLAKSVAESLDSAIIRLEDEWVHLIAINDVPILPWELTYKSPLIYESVDRIEYGYLLVDAVIKTGVKEIVGTLQHQLTDVIKKLDDEVDHVPNGQDEKTRLKLLEEMRYRLSKMKSSFATKLLTKVMDSAINRHKKPRKSKNVSPETNNFLSESMHQIAILMHAFREKGATYPQFWPQMSFIYEKEFNVSIKTDINKEIEHFIQGFVKNQDQLIDLVVQMISRENK